MASKFHPPWQDLFLEESVIILGRRNQRPLVCPQLDGACALPFFHLFTQRPFHLYTIFFFFLFFFFSLSLSHSLPLCFLSFSPLLLLSRSHHTQQDHAQEHTLFPTLCTSHLHCLTREIRMILITHPDSLLQRPFLLAFLGLLCLSNIVVQGQGNPSFCSLPSLSG